MALVSDQPGQTTKGEYMEPALGSNTMLNLKFQTCVAVLFEISMVARCHAVLMSIWNVMENVGMYTLMLYLRRSFHNLWGSTVQRTGRFKVDLKFGARLQLWIFYSRLKEGTVTISGDPLRGRHHYGKNIKIFLLVLNGSKVIDKAWIRLPRVSLSLPFLCSGMKSTFLLTLSVLWFVTTAILLLSVT
jgi:hypothetical protein